MLHLCTQQSARAKAFESCHRQVNTSLVTSIFLHSQYPRAFHNSDDHYSAARRSSRRACPSEKQRDLERSTHIEHTSSDNYEESQSDGWAPDGSDPASDGGSEWEQQVLSTNVRRKRVAVPQEEPLIQSGRESGHPTVHEPAPETVFVTEPPADKRSSDGEDHSTVNTEAGTMIDPIR
jgi:hypothetical protein